MYGGRIQQQREKHKNPQKKDILEKSAFKITAA